MLEHRGSFQDFPPASVRAFIEGTADGISKRVDVPAFTELLRSTLTSLDYESLVYMWTRNQTDMTELVFLEVDAITDVTWLPSLNLATVSTLRLQHVVGFDLRKGPNQPVSLGFTGISGDLVLRIQTASEAATLILFAATPDEEKHLNSFLAHLRRSLR